MNPVRKEAEEVWKDSGQTDEIDKESFVGGYVYGFHRGETHFYRNGMSHNDPEGDKVFAAFMVFIALLLFCSGLIIGWWLL